MSERLRRPTELARDAWRRLRGGVLTPRRAALSVFVGLVVGVTPAFGFHWLLVLALCVPFRLDTGVAYVAANISNPLFAPFLTACEVEVGTLLLRGHLSGLRPSDLREAGVMALVTELFVGTALIAPIVGVFGGLVAYSCAAWGAARRRQAALTEAQIDGSNAVRSDLSPSVTSASKTCAK